MGNAETAKKPRWGRRIIAGLGVLLVLLVVAGAVLAFQTYRMVSANLDTPPERPAQVVRLDDYRDEPAPARAASGGGSAVRLVADRDAAAFRAALDTVVVAGRGGQHARTS